MSISARITLVDDHVVVRNALKELIEAMGDYKVEYQFGNGQDLIDNYSINPLPDLVIMDLIMPIMDGYETMHWLREHKIDYPVLILSMETDKEMIVNLFELGMKGFLPKACSAVMLKQAINDVLEKGHHYNDILIDALQEKKKPSVEKGLDVLKTINEREMEFLKLVCQDNEYTYKEIASIMNVHRRTIDGYRERLFEKCNVISKSGLVQFAIRNKLV